MTLDELKEDIKRLLDETKETRDVTDGMSGCVEGYSMTLASTYLTKAVECLEMANMFMNNKYSV